MGSSIAEQQIEELTDAEASVLLEIYEVLRLTPGNGRPLGTGNMRVWDHAGLSVIYFTLEATDEVIIVRVERWAHARG